MSLDFLVTAIGSRLIEWPELEAAQSILQGLISPFQVEDLRPVLKSSLMAAHRREKHLFKTDDKQVIHSFLAEIFQIDSPIIQELRKPFLGEYNLQESVLQQEIEVFLKDDQDDFINLAHFQLWIKVFIRHYLQEINALEYKVGKRHYLSQLGQRVDRNFFAVPFSLKKTFVLPSATEEVRLVAVKVNEKNEEERTITLTKSAQKFSGEFLLKLIHSHQIVILGNIGSGKTALLDYFCLILSDSEDLMTWGFTEESGWLPILIEVSEWLEYSQNLENLSLLDYVRNQTQQWLQLNHLPDDFFEYWLQEGRTLILVDGLSNVADSSTQIKLAEKIHNFLQEYKHNPAMITVRTEGYDREKLHTQELPHYYLEDFGDSDVQKLVKQWYGKSSESTLLTPSEETTEILRHEALVLRYLSQNSWLENWRKNPFLLTAFLLAIPENKAFPKTRTEIGFRLLPILFECGKDCPELEGFSGTDLPNLIQVLSGKMLKKQGQVIAQDLLIDLLTESMMDLKPIEKTVAENNAIILVKYFRENLGIFNRIDDHFYGFIDPFFPSLFLAQMIREQQKSEGWEIIFEYIKLYLYSPDWQEILRLLIADQPTQFLPKILEFILDFPNPYEFCFHENLLFVGHCLGEDIDPKDESLTQKILNEFAQIFNQEAYEVGNHVKSALLPIERKLKQTQWAEKFTALLHHSPEETSENSSEKTGITSPEKQNLGTLVNQLKSSQPQIRASAVKALGEIENPSDSVIQTLLIQFQDQDPQVRANAVEAISKLNKPHPDTLLPLMSLLQDPSPLVRANAVQAIGHQGEPTESIIYPLLSLLTDTEAIVRASAVQVLGNFPQFSETILYPILSMFGDVSPWVRGSGVIAAAKLAPQSDDVLAILFNFMIQETDLRGKINAVEAFGILGHTSPQVREFLLSLLQNDPSPEIKTQAALALIQLGEPTEKITDLMRQWLEENRDIKGFGIFLDTLWQLLHQS